MTMAPRLTIAGLMMMVVVMTVSAYSPCPVEPSCTICDDGWEVFGGFCWKLNEESMVFAKAKVYCDEMGSELAVPIDDAETQFIGNKVKEMGIGQAWLGIQLHGKTHDDEGIYTSVYEPIQLVHFIKWDVSQDQPEFTRDGKAEHCLAMHENALVHDYPCDDPYHHKKAVCRKTC